MRYTLINWVLLFIFLILLSACKECKDDKKARIDRSVSDCNKNFENLKKRGALKTEGGNCIVLCDFSSSMDSASVRFVKDRANAIFENFYSKYTLQFYPVTNASAIPFYSSDEIAIVDSNITTRPQHQLFTSCLDLKMADQKRELQIALENAFKSRPRATYIIQSLENARDVIHIRDPEHKKGNLIFLLSDMKEFGSSSLGTFNLEISDYDKEIQKIQVVLGQTLSKAPFSGIEIRVGFYSLQPKDRAKLFQFWNLVGKKLSYPKPLQLSSEIDLSL